MSWHPDRFDDLIAKFIHGQWMNDEEWKEFIDLCNTDWKGFNKRLEDREEYLKGYFKKEK